MPNDKDCWGCPYRKSNGWCMLTACANPERNGSGIYVLDRYGYEKKENRGITSPVFPEHNA